jgi:hypothetical protein
MRWRLLATASAFVAVLAALLVMEHAIWEATDWEFGLSVGLLFAGGALALFLLSGPTAEAPEPQDRTTAKVPVRPARQDPPTPIGRRSDAPGRPNRLRARSVVLVLLLAVSVAALAVGWRHGIDPSNAGRGAPASFH